MTPTPTAAQILTRAADLYAKCTTYQDEGVSTRKMFSPDLPNGCHESRQPFRTAFARPSRLFFEYEYYFFDPAGPRYRHVACANERGVISWSSIDAKLETVDSLSLALAGLTGVSGGSAHAVPRLLLPGVITGRHTFPDPGASVLRDESDEDGHPCFVIEGGYRDGVGPVTVYIDRESLLLRRIDSRSEINAESRAKMRQRTKELIASMPAGPKRDRLEQTLSIPQSNADTAAESSKTWRPEMDIAIDPAVFEFRPPDGAAADTDG